MADPRPVFVATDQEKALRAWIRDVLGFYDVIGHTVEVIYARQRAPRPTMPYASLQLFADKVDGPASVRATDTPQSAPSIDYVGQAWSHYSGTVSVSVYGPSSRTMAQRLVTSVDLPDSIELLNNGDVGVSSPLMAITDVPIPRDTSWESRSVVDFPVRYATKTEYVAQAIEKITVTTDMTPDVGGSIEQDVVVP